MKFKVGDIVVVTRDISISNYPSPKRYPGYEDFAKEVLDRSSSKLIIDNLRYVTDIVMSLIRGDIGIIVKHENVFMLDCICMKKSDYRSSLHGELNDENHLVCKRHDIEMLYINKNIKHAHVLINGRVVVARNVDKSFVSAQRFMLNEKFKELRRLNDKENLLALAQRLNDARAKNEMLKL